jgi:outer membrane protein assembly factor BamB
MVGLINKNGYYYAFQRDNLSAGPVWVSPQLASANTTSSDKNTFSPSAWDGSWLYVPARNTLINGVACAGSLNALNPATGAIQWQSCLSGGVTYTAPTVIPGVVLLSAGAHLYAMSTGAGAILWSYKEPSGQPFLAPLTVSNGALYGASSDGTVTTFTVNGQ